MAGLAALVGGSLAALLAALVGLLAAGWYHLVNLYRLVQWTREPVGTPLPRAAGTWGKVFADMSRRSRLAYDMRERLAATLDRFRDASQAMPDGVMYLAESDTIEWMNLKAEQHFGLDHTRDIGAPVTNLVRQPAFVQYLHGGHYEESLVLPSTRPGGLTLQVQVIPFGDGQKMVLSRDISQLERLETMRQDFVANVSHELRTPLTVVGGFLETLIDGAGDFEPDDVQRYLRLALEQSNRMRHLIEDLLTLSALETGAPAPAEERVGVATLVRDVYAEAEALSSGRHQLSLVLDTDAVLLGSHKELRSAFANLCSNAVRYTPDGGRIEVGWRQDDAGGEFWVRDDGIGIDAQHIPRLTERFYRVDRGRSRETGGTGLGLAIVKHILTRHQAELHVVSTPGAGSRFSVRFPRARLMQPKAAALRS
ncbi:phosphate regulon sensor histidine kinase PhoR [Azoarcus olearius]|uniref:Phosphate regulon sensor protein PhoR n=1 Tax=Azoarcus sp. (strain BH72) TaxID=418699 RepID=A1K1S8_AZOSB|nr:phosphate regulon sensor histidine kinase PhoR [Azoarcus olearius]CAL92783.1 phosphate regulon sensor protein [Azoarcus olearius]